MPVSIVIGGQFGSEGKGKISHFLARERSAVAAVRVGGPNSGHTAVSEDGETFALRQLPTAALLPDVKCVIPPGAYIDVQVLQDEMELVNLDPARLLIDRNAVVVRNKHQQIEVESGLGSAIGSTTSGTGAAVSERIARKDDRLLAGHSRTLAPFIGDSLVFLSGCISRRSRVVVEGTQGYGLSLLHTPFYPYATSRDTTAAGALSECGLGPMDVDEVVLVIRSYPIRVAGNSGPFGSEELTWSSIANENNLGRTIDEFTTVTKRLRRVARFEPELVRRAILANSPTSIALNHVDLVDGTVSDSALTTRAKAFVSEVEYGIGANVDLVGLGPNSVVRTNRRFEAAA